MMELTISAIVGNLRRTSIDISNVNSIRESAWMNGSLAHIMSLDKPVLLLDLGKIFSGGDMAIAPLQKPDLDMGVTS